MQWTNDPRFEPRLPEGDEVTDLHLPDDSCCEDFTANGRSWRWTKRARALGWTLVILLSFLAGWFAYLLPWVQNP